MAEARTNRRLAAILAADVVAYSRMMARDEAGTLAALKRHREVVFNPAVTKHGGRIVKLIGDGSLVEFASVVEAVNCALSIQRSSPAEGSQARLPIVLRIGVNLGDIIIDGDDIYGDGVNVAARLEPLAEPGGICVSSVVNDHLGNRIDVRFIDAGEVHVKNIERPIRIWKWHPTVSGGGSTPSAVPLHAQRGGLPLLAVLPFQNMSGDREQEYFADGVVEDLITALSRFKSFAVIARNSSFVYKDRAVDVRQFAREVGVRYVVEGSVRRSGNRLRIAAQLLDGTNGAHLWAHNFDGAVEDVFDVQDRITEGVVAVVEPKIQRAEIDRSRRERPESLDAYDLYLRALQKINTSRPDDNAAGLELLDRTIAQEPGYAVALALAANGLQHRLTMGWPAMTDDDEGKCLRLAREALAIGGDDPLVLARCGLVLLLVGREYDRGLQILKRALAANPNDVLVLSHAGLANVLSGSLDEAVALLHRAIDLSPGDAWSGMTGLAEAHLCLGQYEEAVEWASRSLAENPNFNVTYWILIAANAHLGRMDEARHELATLQAMAPGVSIARLGLRAKDQRSNDIITQGLRLAGMPEV
jgi:TolB-like protein/class 3 adenylate cyclase/tetratricopeptide (TPR) repeat protein